MTQWDISDDYAIGEHRFWYDSWLHKGMSVESLEPGEAAVVSLCVLSRLNSIGFIQDNNYCVDKS